MTRIGQGYLLASNRIRGSGLLARGLERHADYAKFLREKQTCREYRRIQDMLGSSSDRLILSRYAYFSTVPHRGNARLPSMTASTCAAALRQLPISSISWRSMALKRGYLLPNLFGVIRLIHCVLSQKAAEVHC